MLRFWRNPEYVRHVRAELRPPRAITVGLVALVICALVGLSCWSSARDNLHDFFRHFHVWLVGIQFTVLGFWCASNCGQAISRERELKTYDFLKTTRLTSAELMIGKILGAPIMAYFVVGCSLPVSVVTGLLSGYGPGRLLQIYVLLLVFALFISLLGLWISMLLEKSSSAAVGVLALLPIAWSFSFTYSPFPGYGALSIFPAIFTVYQVDTEILRAKPTLFGVPTSYVALTVLLYIAFGAWLALMLIRNLKKDREQIRLLSHWQAVGFAAFLNALFYAFLDPKLLTRTGANTARPEDISGIAMALNGLFLFMVGLATLTPREKLKVWWRRLEAAEPYFSESGLPWPWLVASALVAYVLLVAEALGLRGAVTLDRWHLGTAALELLALLIFATRDILFLQWCNITGMKRPLIKGFLYLCLSYAAVLIFAAVEEIGTSPRNSIVFQVFTPYGVFLADSLAVKASPGIYVGMVVQLGIIALVLKAIAARLQRPATLAVAPAA